MSVHGRRELGGGVRGHVRKQAVVDRQASVSDPSTRSAAGMAVCGSPPEGVPGHQS